MSPPGISAIAAIGEPRAAALALARTGGARVWEFVAAAVAIGLGADDQELRFHLASAYARLGLSTAARAALTKLIAECRGPVPSAWSTLMRTVGGMPDDRISLEARVRIAGANVAVLAARGIDFAPALERWRVATADGSWFRTRDGNIVRQCPGPDGPVWTRWGDEAGRARACVLPDLTAGQEGQPFYLEGIDPPWLLQRLAAHTPRRSDGFHRRLVIVQRDEQEWLDGLACADLGAILAESRVVCFVGEEAGAALAADLADRADLQIAGRSMSPAAARRPVEPPLHELVSTACENQQRDFEQITQEVAARYQTRDQAFWAARFARAREGGSAEPLRVLIPTTRFSTFIKHSSRDIAAACESIGAKAEVLLEPSDDSWLSALAFARAMERFDPDLVLLINYTRAQAGSWVPPQVPFVCWVQDAMPHLFDAASGAAQGPMDFITGHLHSDLFNRFGYPRGRAIYTPVLVSEQTFHDGPMSDEVARAHACEVAYVSHQSETPEATCERLASAWTGALAVELAAATRQLLAPLRRLMDGGLGPEVFRSIEPICGGLLAAALGRAVPAEALARLRFNVAHPIAERLLRHQMLAWAEELCQERGWRFHLYGRGWEKHPTLAHRARGEISHDEALRASYRHARVSLHGALGMLQHQRVMECALSGGLTLVRIKRDDADHLAWWAQETIAATPGVRVEPMPVGYHAEYEGGELKVVRIADHAPAMLAAAQRGRLGLDAECGAPPGCLIIQPQQRTHPWHLRGGRPWPQADAWLAGDLADVGFWSRETFRAAAERAISDGDARAALAARQRRAVLAHSTYPPFVAELLDFVTARLQA